MLTYIQSLGTSFTHTHVKECFGIFEIQKKLSQNQRNERPIGSVSRDQKPNAE